MPLIPFYLELCLSYNLSVAYLLITPLSQGQPGGIYSMVASSVRCLLSILCKHSQTKWGRKFIYLLMHMKKQSASTPMNSKGQGGLAVLAKGYLSVCQHFQTDL